MCNWSHQAQGRETTFIMGQDLLKKALLHLKRANILFLLSVCVLTVPEKMVDTPRFLDLRFGLYSPNHLG